MTEAPQWMTPDELAAYSGGRIPVETIRYHCRVGQLVTIARRAGRSWIIEARPGKKWADKYEPYGSLRREAGPGTPSPGPAISPRPSTRP